MMMAACHGEELIYPVESFRVPPRREDLPAVLRLRAMRLPSLVAFAAGLMLSWAPSEGRLVHPSDLMMQALRSRTFALDATLTAEQVDGYHHASGFPKAGRTLAQKIAEAEQFLAEQIPKSGIVGTGVAVVYEDQVVLAKGYGLRSSKDLTSKVTADGMFQIGSVSKTMVAVGIGMLVEDNKLAWRDPVKKHLPWLSLFDKYAEKHLTIGDLLSMNSGFNAVPDLPDFFGKFPTERLLVEALKDCEPQFSLREQPEYANVNFVILGQLIESVTGMPWHKFLHERLWTPLGMDHTFASAPEIPLALRQQALNDGHFACDGEVIGPFDLVSAPEMQLSIGREGGYNAAGSVVSSSADMATFLRLILNKGKVGNVTLLRSPSTITEIVSGKNVATGDIGGLMPMMGLHFDQEGGTIAAGYGIDIIGQAIWGHAYFDKSGDVIAHQTRTGFASLQKLAVIFMGNSQVPDSHASFYLDHYRSYVLGIFLDVPKSILDFEFKKWRAADQLQPPIPGAPRCGFRFWKNPPAKTLTADEEDTLVGTYVATTSSNYNPKIKISRTASTDEKALIFEMASIKSKLTYLGRLSGAMLMLADGEWIPLPFLVTKNAQTGEVATSIMADYRKQQ